MNRAFLLFLLTMSFGLSSLTRQSSYHNDDIQLSIALQDTIYCINDTVTLEVTIVNISKKRMLVFPVFDTSRAVPSIVKAGEERNVVFGISSYLGDWTHLGTLPELRVFFPSDTITTTQKIILTASLAFHEASYLNIAYSFSYFPYSELAFRMSSEHWIS